MRQFIAFMAWGLTGCANPQPLHRFEYNRLCMGVEARIVLYSEEKTNADDAARAAFERLAQLDSIMSDYRRDSELMRLTDRSGAGPVKISADLFAVLEASLAVSRCTGGAFDVTVGPAVQRWREARRTLTLPDDESLAAARSLIGWRNVVLDASNRTVELKLQGMQLDLGGIGKGYAAQQAVDLLKSRGVNSCMVALAGDIVTGDSPPSQRGWCISIDESATRTLLLVNAAISTSGDAEQFIEINSVRYSHLIDPRTGLGMTVQRSVTVIAPRGELADALSSALCVMGPQGAEGVLGTFHGAAAIIEEGAGDSRTRMIIDPSHQLEWAAEQITP